MGNPTLPTPKQIVIKLFEAEKNPRNHRSSASKGIYKLRCAITDWYQKRYDVALDPEAESVVTIGAREGLGPLALATIGPGDVDAARIVSEQRRYSGADEKARHPGVSLCMGGGDFF